jgi:polyribonucleotide nucleotidyltransferase
MASVCGGCLALMDAGVPIKNPVAGIAMGMLLKDNKSVSDEDAIIVSDILGTEDALGTMDFKVAGDRHGITTFQLDIKCEGLSLETMERALEQARKGRLHILDAMEKALPKYRDLLPSTVPKITSFSINPETIGKVIGPGGKQIRAVIEDFELVSMDVSEEGLVQLSSFKDDKLVEAEEFVKALVSAAAGGGRGGPRKDDRPAYVGPDAVEGQIYKGKITGIHQFGVFLEILPGAEDGSTPGLEGLCHVSELDRQRIRNCEGFVKSLGVEELEVIYQGKSDKGKVQLSRKAVMELRAGIKPGDKPPAPPKRVEAPPAPIMSEDELDVIAKAIEGAIEM